MLRVSDDVLRWMCDVVRGAGPVAPPKEGMPHRSFIELLHQAALDLEEERAAHAATKAEVERLESENEALRVTGCTRGDAPCLLAQVREAEAEAKRLRTALMPFTRHYERVKHLTRDKVARYEAPGSPLCGWITMAELRQAAEAATEVLDQGRISRILKTTMVPLAETPGLGPLGGAVEMKRAAEACPRGRAATG